MPVARGEDVRAISFKARRSGSASSPSPEGSKNFLGEFFFTTTWRLLRSGCSRSVPRDVPGWSRSHSSNDLYMRCLSITYNTKNYTMIDCQLCCWRGCAVGRAFEGVRLRDLSATSEGSDQTSLTRSPRPTASSRDRPAPPRTNLRARSASFCHGDH